MLSLCFLYRHYRIARSKIVWNIYEWIARNCSGKFFSFLFPPASMKTNNGSKGCSRWYNDAQFVREHSRKGAPECKNASSKRYRESRVGRPRTCCIELKFFVPRKRAHFLSPSRLPWRRVFPSTNTTARILENPGNISFFLRQYLISPTL